MSDDLRERRDWSDQELDLIVADYFEMLRDEAAGVHFNKAEHNRLLRDGIDPSKSSIEFKHRNISAVLQKLGLPIITGYYPAENFQKAIIPSIDRYLSQNPAALHPEHAARGDNAVMERAGLFVGPPPPLLPVTLNEKTLNVSFESSIQLNAISGTVSLGMTASSSSYISSESG